MMVDCEPRSKRIKMSTDKDGKIVCPRCNGKFDKSEYTEYALSDFKHTCRECLRKYMGQEKFKEARQGYRKKYNESEKAKEYSRQYRGNNREQSKARGKVANAIKYGRLKKAGEFGCNNCDKTATEYHHDRYEKEHWLDVIPPCRSCHRLIHTRTEVIA